MKKQRGSHDLKQNQGKIWKYVLEGSAVGSLADFLIDNSHELGINCERFSELVGNGFTQEQFWQIIAGEAAPDKNLTARFAVIFHLNTVDTAQLETFALFARGRRYVKIIHFPENEINLAVPTMQDYGLPSDMDQKIRYLTELWAAKTEFYEYLGDITNKKITNAQEFAERLKVDAVLTEGLRRPRANELSLLNNDTFIPLEEREKFEALTMRFFGHVRPNPPIEKGDCSAHMLSEEYGGRETKIETQLRTLRRHLIAAYMEERNVNLVVATAYVDIHQIGWRKPLSGPEALYVTAEGKELWLDLLHNSKPKLYEAKREFYDYLGVVTKGKITNPEEYAAALKVDSAVTEGWRRPRDNEIKQFYDETFIPASEKDKFETLAAKFFDYVALNPPVGEGESSATMLSEEFGGPRQTIEQQMRVLRQRLIDKYMKEHDANIAYATAYVDVHQVGWRQPPQGIEVLYVTEEGKKLWLELVHESRPSLYEAKDEFYDYLREVTQGKITNAEEFAAALKIDSAVTEGWRRPRNNEIASFYDETLIPPSEKKNFEARAKKFFDYVMPNPPVAEGDRSANMLSEKYGGRHTQIETQMRAVRRRQIDDYMRDNGAGIAAATAHVDETIAGWRKPPQGMEALYLTEAGEKLWLEWLNESRPKLYEAKKEFYDYLSEVTQGKITNAEEFATALKMDAAVTEGWRRPRAKEPEKLYDHEIIPPAERERFEALAMKFFDYIIPNPPVNEGERSANQLAQAHGGNFANIEKQVRALRKDWIDTYMREEGADIAVATAHVDKDLAGWRKPAQGKEALYVTPEGERRWLQLRQEVNAPPIDKDAGELSADQLSKVYRTSTGTIKKELALKRAELIEDIAAQTEGKMNFSPEDATHITDRYLIGDRKPARGAQGISATKDGQRIWAEDFKREKRDPEIKL